MGLQGRDPASVRSHTYAGGAARTQTPGEQLIERGVVGPSVVSRPATTLRTDSAPGSVSLPPTVVAPVQVGSAVAQTLNAERPVSAPATDRVPYRQGAAHCAMPSPTPRPR
ncbi:hypothetical protein GCM10010294_09500 [Streptomyces griseoloalbus]|nr:hypothetical protein GCM10010294_09500 [Streptomyces griseoloalbus]